VKPPSMSKSPKPGGVPISFEQAMKEFEELVARMESGALPLEESLAAYQRGLELSAYCQKTLDEAEQRVKILENNVLKDFKPDRGQ